MVGIRSRRATSLGCDGTRLGSGGAAFAGRQHGPRPWGTLAAALLLLVTACGADASDGSDTSQDSTSAATSGSASGQSAAAPSSHAQECAVSDAIADMSLRDRLAQLLVVGVDAASPDTALAAVRDEHVGGLFLVGEDTALFHDGGLRRVQEASRIQPTIAVDDEGGRVQRVAELAGSIPSAREMADAMRPGGVD